MASDRDSGGDDDEFYEPDDIAELHQGIVNNDLELLRQVLEAGVSPNEKFPADVNPQHEGMTPLALASALNKVEAVKLLLTYQANVNDSFASLKTTALMTSSFHGHSEIVRILLRKGADVRAVDLQGSTALGYAFGGARTIEVIHQLLKAGIDVNQKNMLGMNALLLVAGYGNDVLAKMILDAGADANSTNDFGHSALHLTVVGKRSQIKKLLSGQTGSYGLNRRNIDVALKEWARLHRDTLRGQDNERELEKVGEFMMSIGSKLDERDYNSDDDNEAMKRRVEAVWRHRQDKIQEGKAKKPGVLDNFLSCGGKRSKQAKHGSKSPAAKPFDPLDNYSGRAINSPDADRDVNQISESCSKILRMIIDSGCEIDKMEKTFGMTALDMAILLGDVESTAILVAAGGDSNHLMKMFALTDLYEALVQLDKKQIKELLTFDSDIDVNQPFSQFNITNRRGNGETNQLKSDGMTPLTVAAQLNEVEVLDIMKQLQKQGADINKVGPGGSCPLAEACRTGNLKMVQFLVSQGADIEMRCPAYKDATPVTVAAMSGHRLIVEFLLAKDAKIDKPMSDGRSALIRAVENSDWEMVEQIFNANLHDNFNDHNNFSYDMAERYQRPDRDFDTLKRAITDEARQFADRDREESMQKNKAAGRFPPGSVGPMVGQQNNQRRQTSLDDPVPSSYGRMGRVPDVQLIPEQQRQQRPDQQKQQFRQQPPKPPSPEESSEEEEEEDDDDEEEEKQQQQRLRQQQQQQQPKQVQQQQQKQQKQQKPVQPPPARPPPPPAESSSEEEEEDEEEEEFSNRQQLQHQPKQQQQQPKQQQQQPKQQLQQPPKQQQQQPKQQQQQPKQQQQMKEQQIRRPLPPEKSSSEEEDDEEEEVRKPQQQQQQRLPAAGKLAVAPAAKLPQKKPESSEEEEEEDDDEDDDDEEEEVKPVPPVQVKKQVVPQMPVTRPPGNQAISAKPVQKQPSSEEEETEEEEESEEEEVVKAPPKKATPANILPSAKFENRTFQAMPNHSAAAAASAIKGSPARPNNVQAKQNSSTPNRAPGPPAAASVKSPMSPSGPPPPLPSTGPPSDTPTESEEEDEESDEDEEDFGRNHAPVVTKNNNKISSPTKNKTSSQSTVTTTKGSGGVTTRTVVTKTVVTSNVTAKGRPNVAKVEVSDDDDEDEDDDDEDEEEESDEDNERARYHSTETDI